MNNPESTTRRYGFASVIMGASHNFLGIYFRYMFSEGFLSHFSLRCIFQSISFFDFVSVFGCLNLACNISDKRINLNYIVKIVAFKANAKFDKQNAYFLDILSLSRPVMPIWLVKY